MFNWNTDEKTFKRKYPKEYKLWRLTQLINYGLDGEKLDEKEVKAAWPKIKDRLDLDKRKTMDKFDVITSTPTGKAYADLYMILQKTNWPMNKIREDAANRHKVPIIVETIYLASLFLRAVEFDLPKMLAPFDRKKMEEFFLSEAKKLKKEIIK